MSRSALRVLLSLLLSLWCAVAVAGGYGVEVVRTSPFVLDTGPGQALTANFRVMSKTTEVLSLREELELPPGWQPLLAPSTYDLSPAGTLPRLVGWVVPPDAAAGTYAIVYRVRGTSHPAMGSEDRVRVIVRTQSKVTLTAMGAPGTLPAGQCASFQVRVANEGNVAVRVAVAAAGEENLTVTLGRQVLSLPPGGAETLPLEACADPHETRRTLRAVRVHAWSTIGSAEPVETALAVSIDLLPRPSHRVDVLRELPAQVALRVTSGNERTAIQPELQARGPLDAKERTLLDLYLRGPDADGSGTYGLRDEARVTLATPMATLRAGDQNYGTSPLLSPGRYGRGAALQAHHGGLEAEIHHVTSRFDAPPLTETGGWVAAELDPLRMAAAAMRKLEEVDGVLRGDLLGSLDARVRPTDGTLASAEIALDRGDEGGMDEAWRLGSEGTIGRFNYAVSGVHAGPDFHGYYTDQRLGAASLGVRPIDVLIVRTSGQVLRSNLALDPMLDAPQILQGEAALQGVLPSDWVLEGGYVTVRQDDLLSSLSQYVESAGRARLSRGKPAYTVRLEALVGWHRDLPGSSRSPVQQLSAMAEVRPSPREALGIYGTLGLGEPATSTVFALDDMLGLSASWMPVPPLRLELAGQRTINETTVDQAELRASYRWRERATVQLQGRVQHRAGLTDRSALVLVAVPFGAPIGRDRTVGAIRGRLFDANTPDGRGLEGIVVTAGGAVAVTDNNGRFTLSGLSPGEQVVNVDQSMLAMDWVPNVALPLAVEVGAGRVSEVTIGFTAGGRVRGQLMLRAAEAAGGGPVVLGDGRPLREGGLADVLVTLTDGEVTLTRVTDGEGRFAFDGVRPGHWTVMARASDLPPHTVLEVERAEIDVGRGSTALVEFVARRQARPIRMIEGGTLQIGPP